MKYLKQLLNSPLILLMAVVAVLILEVIALAVHHA